MDWLRIAAFAILILYHSALHFGPHHWIVRAGQTYDWLALPLAGIAPWRLMVLFAVSGFASAAMMGKFGGLWRFFRERSSRLLIPLVFGVIVLVPPQSWARAVVDTGYASGYLHFWVNDFFRFSAMDGHTLPHWEHLWFLGYLWAYTGLLVLLVATFSGWRGAAGALAQVLGRGHRLLFVPLAILVLARLALTKLGLTGTGMFDDWIGDSHYVPAFLFGFLIAVEPHLWASVRRIGVASAGVAALSYLVIAYFLVGFHSIEEMPSWAYGVELAADSAMGWSAMLAAIALADVAFNRDHPWRETLARAVFPAYLVHQTVIVLVGLWLRPMMLGGWIAYAIIALSVLLVSIAAWLLASRSRLIGPLLGVVLPETPVKGRLAPV